VESQSSPKKTAIGYLPWIPKMYEIWKSEIFGTIGIFDMAGSFTNSKVRYDRVFINLIHAVSSNYVQFS
jgi:hypothetical protein